MKKLNQKNSIIKFILITFDILAFFIAFNASYFLWVGTWNKEFGILSELIIVLFLNISIGILFNIYSITSKDMRLATPERFFISSLFGIIASVLVTFILPARYEGGMLGRGPFLLGLIFFISMGFLTRKFFFIFFRNDIRELKILFISSLQSGDSLFQDLQKLHYGVNITLLHDPGLNKKKSQRNLKLLKKINECKMIQKRDNWKNMDQYLNTKYDAIVLGLNQVFPDDITNQLMALRIRGQIVYDISEFYESMLQKIPVFHIREGWFIFSTGFNILHEPLKMKIKRIMDIILSVTLLILSFPMWVITALAIKLESPGPVFFSQERTGFKDEPFIVYKFRSMRQDAEKDGAKWAMKNDDRVTRIGKFIRLVRIDELPQLWNVLKGDMSFIGPRPERPIFIKTLEKKIPYYNLRHLVKPGITGWAQVMYPYGASVEDAKEKLEYDLFYIKNYSLILDMRIIFKTIRIVLFGKGR